MLTENDLTTLKNRGITLEQLNDQLERFRTGFPYLRLEGSATVGHGITAVNDSLTAEAVARWDKYLADGGSVCKFVPASGAASRMFKALFSPSRPNSTPHSAPQQATTPTPSSRRAARKKSSTPSSAKTA